MYVKYWNIKQLLAVLALFISSFAVQGAQLTIDYTVSGKDSLFYTDWGHDFNLPGAGNQYDALGRGIAAGHVGYAFTSGQSLDVSANSCVRDAGWLCTGADGFFGLGSFRGLDVYSMIGIWSESDTEIDAVGDAFVVGSSASLIAPEATGSLYLYLGENDGIFADNYFHDHYHVSITVSEMAPAVPVPAAVWLFTSGLLALLGMQRRRVNC